MRILRNFLSWFVSILSALLLSLLVLTRISFGAEVKVCKKLKDDHATESSEYSAQDRRIFCNISPRLGSVGDFIDIKNQYNYIVAIGRVVKESRLGTIIVLTKSNPKEGSMSGYSAMLRVNENQDYWTATTAPF